MARPKTGQKSRARLEVEKKVYEYLNVVGLEFESTKIPTLPSNEDGKINVSELASNMGLSEAQRKNHLYKDKDIISEINRHAKIQKLKPVGESKYNTALEEDAKHQIATHSKRAKISDEQLIETQSQNIELILENKRLKERVLQLESCVHEFYESGIMPDIR